MRFEEIQAFYEDQKNIWNLAERNIELLKSSVRKPFRAGDLDGYVLLNAARAVSTLARIDKDSIERRKCFLCANNRPAEQKGIEILSGFELLVNPFPILPFHFTIVHKQHVPQTLILETGLELAEILENMVVFFNAAGAGASAPDHLHFQAVPKEELPLIKLLEEKSGKPVDLPFTADCNPDRTLSVTTPLNAYFWKSQNETKFVVIHRKTHRPKEFYLDPPFRRGISPGAIDMAGVLVTPFQEDFDSISEEDIVNIYRQVAF